MCLLNIILFHLHKSLAGVGNGVGMKSSFSSKTKLRLREKRLAPDRTVEEGFEPRTLPHS